MSYALVSDGAVSHSRAYISSLLKLNPNPATTYLMSVEDKFNVFEQQMVLLGEKYEIPIVHVTVKSLDDWYDFWDRNDSRPMRGIVFSGDYKPSWVMDKMRDIDQTLDLDNMAYGQPAVVSAVLRLVEYYPGIAERLSGSRALVIGRSDTVGKRLAMSLLDGYDCEVTITHRSASRSHLDLPRLLKQHEFVFSCIPEDGGNPLTPELMRDGSYLFDIGGALVLPERETYKRDADGNVIYRDGRPITPNSIYYTPKRGGVGPLTTHILLERILTPQNRR